MMPSHEVDNDCYWQAVHAVFGTGGGIQPIDDYTHVTDSGILSQWTRQQLGRPAREAEVMAIRAGFLRRLQKASRERPQDFLPTPGLRDWLQARRACGAGLAIATGGWGHTARFKLECAGLADLELPLASADDAMPRADIMRAALRLLTPAAARATYIGDGPWDARASAELGWDFIGIASGKRADRLRAAGAGQVHADFRALARAVCSAPGQAQ